MRTKLGLSGASALLSVAIPVLAHHSYDAEFDRSKPVSLKGIVTKVEWMNPHVWVYLNVADASGKTAKWQCENGAPNMLKRSGWNRESVKEGDTVTIEGTLAKVGPNKDGSNTCNVTALVLANGTRVFAGSSGGNGQAK